MKWRIFVNLALGFLLADWLLRYLSAGRLERLLNSVASDVPIHSQNGDSMKPNTSHKQPASSTKITQEQLNAAILEEREACAKVIEQQRNAAGGEDSNMQAMAAAIRNRTQKTVAAS